MSQTIVGLSWLAQFAADDRLRAAELLDAMLLLNEEQVSTSIRSALDRLAGLPRHRKARVALYAEREFEAATIFDVQLVADETGRLRRRAVGYNGPPAVKPVRGRARVGSEGSIAHYISQSVERWPKVFMNHPGPDRLRGKTAPAGEIAIVTDFLGSGTRVSTMLDKFWAVPTIQSWVSRDLVRFRVIAAAATSSALSLVRSHRLRPAVDAEWIAPTLETSSDYRKTLAWRRLVNTYGPQQGRGAGRAGFGEVGALIAFSYRLPNNTPAIIHAGGEGWNPLYLGPAPSELRQLFGVRSVDERILDATEANGIKLGVQLTEEDQLTIVVLSMLRGRWYPSAEIALASRTLLPVPTVLDVLRRALKTGLITKFGRLTDQGYAFMAAGRSGERKTPIIATSRLPYYPETLRIP